MKVRHIAVWVAGVALLGTGATLLKSEAEAAKAAKEAERQQAAQESEFIAEAKKQLSQNTRCWRKSDWIWRMPNGTTLRLFVEHGR